MKTKIRSYNGPRKLICTLPFAALFAVSASAANISWTGATDAVWSSGGNWVGGNAPTAGDVAVFDAGSVANLSSTLGVDRTIQGLRITSPGGLITIGAGNLLTLGAGGIDMSAASQNLLINALVALSANQSWNVANGRTLTANGIISGTNVNLNKIGLGDLVLGGANTFTGTTTIGGGTLTLNGSLNGTTGTDLTFAGTGIFHVSAASGVSQGMGVLSFNAGDGVVKSTNNGGTSTLRFSSRGVRNTGATGSFVLSGGTAGTPGNPGTLGTNNIAITSGETLTAQLMDRGLFYNGSQYAAYDAGGFVRGLIYGGIDANAPATIPTGPTLGVNDATKNVQISGDITAQTTASVNTISVPGSFTITLAGGQTLSFNGILKSGGNAGAISAGGLGTQLNTPVSGNEIVIRTDAAGDSLTINVPIFPNGANPLTKSGAGTLTLNAANNYTGATYVNGGTLMIGAGGIINNNNYTAPIAVVGGATFNFNSTANQILGGVISGAGAVVKDSSGTLTLSGANTFNGGLTVKSGVVSFGTWNDSGTGPLGNYGNTGAGIVLNGGTLSWTADSNTNTGVIPFTLGLGGGTLREDHPSQQGSFSNTGAIPFTGSGARILTFGGASSYSTNFNPAIGDGPGGATSVTKINAGSTWTLLGANTYTGMTTVSGGVLNIGKKQALNGGVAAFVPAKITVESGAALVVGAGDAPNFFTAADIATILDASHLGSSTSSTGLKTGAQFGIDTLNANAGVFTYNNVLADLNGSNPLNFAKYGNGTLILDQANTYTGTTTIYVASVRNSTSILRAGNAQAFGLPTTAQLIFGASNNQSNQGVQLNGFNITVVGLTAPTLAGGANPAYVESGSATAGTDTLTVNNAIDNDFNGNLRDGNVRKLALVKGGAGTLSLNRSNSYSGGTIINSGIIRAGSTDAFVGSLVFGSGSTGKIQVNGNTITVTSVDTNATVGTPIIENASVAVGRFTVSNTVNSTFAGVIQDGAGGGTLILTKNGTGTLTLPNNHTYTGATTVNAGALILSGNNTTAIGDMTINGGIVQFNTQNSINGGVSNPGSANRDVTINLGGTVLFGSSFGTITDIQFALAKRILGSSAGAIAADNFAASNFNFNTPGLVNASLGAVGNVNYSGILSPNSGVFRLGGGGGTLTYSRLIPAANSLSITGATGTTTGTGMVVLSNAGNAITALTVTSGILDLNGTTTQSATTVAFNGGIIQNGKITGGSYTASGATINVIIGGSGVFTSTGATTLNANNSSFGGAIQINSGTLKAVDFRSLGTNTVTLNGGNANLNLTNDGLGTGTGNGKLENINYGNDIRVTGSSQSIIVGQFTAGVGPLNAANKTLQLNKLLIGAHPLSVTNSNGFGLDFTGGIFLSDIPTLSVANSAFVNGVTFVNTPVVSGLTISGPVTGAFGIIKSGIGTLALTNPTNDFGAGGGGSFIDITGGLLSVNSDAALGQTPNIVKLNANGAGLQLNPDGTGSFSRQINTSVAGGVIDVTQFGTTNANAINVATLTTAFNGGAASTNAFTKIGNGILEIAANNNGSTPYTGLITINAGAIRASNAGALGSNANGVVVNDGGALQLNGITTDEPLNIRNSGINSGGALQALANTTNTVSGAITMTEDGHIGADSGATLNINGTFAPTAASIVTFAGAGNININSGIGASTEGINKIGNGTTTVSGASNLFDRTLTIHAGIFKMDGVAKFANTNNVTVNSGGTLTLDNSVTSTDDRLGGTARSVTLNGGTISFIGNGPTLERTARLTINAGLGTINTSASGTMTFNDMVRNAGGVVNVSSTGSSSVRFAAAPGLNDSILQGWFVGNDFATHGGNNTAITAYSAYNTGNISSAATTDNVNPASNQTGVTTRTINTLKLANNVGLAINAGQTLTLDAGGLINNGGGNITGGSITSNTEFIAHYATDAQISSIITSGQSFTKTGVGNLTLSALDNYTGTTTINQGTLTLSAGNNTLTTIRPMLVNKGGTLALGANSQYIGALTSVGSVESGGGNITGTGTLTSNGSSGNFAGNIGSDGGALNFVRAGSGTLNLYSPQGTTGTLSIIGGELTLKDGATLSGITGTIAINGATLTIDNNGTKDVADRINNSAITLDSGTINFRGRTYYNSTETLGAVTANSGMNLITASIGGGSVSSAQLTLSSLSRTDGAVIRVDGSSVGQIGNAGRIVVASGLSGNLTPVNGIVPGVISSNAGGQLNMVGYSPGLGFGAVGTAGFPGTVASIDLAGPTSNLAGGGVVASGGQIINSISNGGGITFANTNDLLTLAAGMWGQGGGGTWGMGTTTVRGRLTSGLASGELFLMKTNEGGGGAAPGNIHSVITDNGGTRVKLIVAQYNRDDLQNQRANLTANNTYTGGTVVSGGNTLMLSATNPGDTTIPAANDPALGLIINNSQVTMVTNAGQIAAGNIVTLNGGSTLNYVGNNTQAGFIFNSNGGTGTPTINPAGTLTLIGNITSTPTNVAVVPIVNGGTLDLNNTGHNITVDGGATATSLFHTANGAAVTGLTISSNISSPIAASGIITKLGTGVLELTGANSFTGGLLIGDGTAANAGAVKASNSANALGGNGNIVTLNNGALWLNNTALTLQTFVVSPNGGSLAALADQAISNITLNGTLNVSLADPTQNNVDRSITINLDMTGGGSLVVGGNANNTTKFLLLNSSNNTYSGGTTINSGGRVKLGAISALGSSSSPLTINAGGVFDLNNLSDSVGNLTGSGGTITNTNTGATALSIGNGNTGGGNFAGVISNGSGTVSLSKVGSGTITLSGNNTYSGGTTLSGGTLVLGSPAALGVGTFTITAGTALDSAVVNLVNANNNLQNWNGNFAFTGTNSLNLGTGAVAMNATRTVTVDASVLTVGGVVSGAGFGLTKAGAGTLVLNGANTFTGATTLSAGTLSVGTSANLGNGNALIFDGGTLQITGTALTSFSGHATTFNADRPVGLDINNAANTFTISQSLNQGTGGLTKSGAGTLVLGGANTYTGATTVNGGTLKLDYTTNNTTKLADASALTLVGSTLDLSGGSHTEIVGSTTVATGVSTVSRSSGTSVLRLNALTRDAGGAVNFTTGDIASTSTANDASGILGLWATVGGTDWATNSGTTEGGGNNFITAYNGYTDIAATGATVAGAATSNVRINSAGSGGNDVLGGPMTVLNTLMQNTGTASTVTLAGGTLRVNGIMLNTAAESLTIGAAANDGTLTSATSAGLPDVTLINNSASKALTINSAIADNTLTSTLSKLGAGTVILAGANSYSGGTTIGAGVLQVGSGGASGSLGSGNVSNSGSLVFDQIGALAVHGVISGVGSLAQNGTGTVTLAGTNIYTGTTTLSAGTLSVGVDANLGSGNGLIFNGGTLQITGTALTSYGSGAIGTHAVTLTAGKTVGFDIANAANTFTISQVLNQGAGGMTKLGAGTLVLSGANTFAGAAILRAGTLSVGADVNLGNANALIFDGGTLQITGTALTSYAAGAIGSHAVTLTTDKTAGFDISSAANVFTVSQILSQGTGGLTKAGSGTLVLLGENTYSGATTVNGGVLQIGTGGTSGSLGTGSVSNNASLIFNRSDTLTVSNSISGGGSLAQNGSGTLTLTGVNTFTGSLTLGAGVLSVGAEANLGDANALVFNGGTLKVTGTALTNLGSHTATFNAGKTVGLDISSAGNIFTFSQSLNQNGGGLDKAGAGTLILGGANTYSGSTTISAGVLQVGNGGTSGSLGSGSVTNNSSLIFNRSDALAVPSVISGSGTLTQVGNGTLTLSGANTYTGTTTLSAGTLSIGTAANLGSANALVFDGGTLQVTGTSLGNFGNHTVSFVSGKTVGLDIGNSGNIFAVGQVLNQGTGGLLKTGAGTLALNAVNTFTGPVTLSEGSLSVASDANLGNTNALIFDGGTLQITGTALASYAAGSIGSHAVTLTSGKAVGFDINNAAHTFTVSQVLNQGAGGLIKAGGGTLVLLGANTYSGTTTVNAGTLTITGAPVGGGAMSANGGVLKLDYSTNDVTKVDDAALLTLGGGTLELAGGTHVEVVGSTSISSGTSTVTRSVGASVLRMNALARTSGGAVNFAAGNIASTSTANTNGILGAWATVGGTDWATNSGAAEGRGNNFVTAYTVYTNIATKSSAIINNAANNVRINSVSGFADIALGSTTTTINTLMQAAAQTSTVAMTGKTLRLNGVMLNPNGSSLSIGVNAGEGTMTSAVSSGTPDVTLINNNTTPTILLVINSVIADNTVPSSLSKAGVGTVVLTAVNTFTGPLTLSEGTLRIGSDANLGNGNALIFDGGTLQVTGTALTSYAAGLIGSHPVTLSSGRTVGFDINNSSNIFTVSQSLSQGSGGLTKLGNGTLRLTGVNTYTGTTTVGAGVLQVGNGGTTGNLSTGNVINNGTIVFNRSDAFTVPSLISGTGSLTNSGTGTLTLSGANTYTGTTTLSAATLIFGSSSAIGTGPLLISGGILDSALPNLVNSGNNPQNWNSNINFAGSNSMDLGSGAVVMSATRNVTVNANTLSIGGSISGTGFGLTKLGAGKLVLGGANTFTGPTTLSEGTLSVGADANFGSATNAVIFDGGVLQITGTALTSFGTHSLGVTLNKTAVLDIASAANNFTVSQILGQGTGGLTKAGAGTLTFSQTNTYTGMTTVDGGTLVLGGSLSGAVTVNNSGTLTGDNVGMGDVIVNNGGTFSPGANGIGTLSTGTVTFGAGSILKFEIDTAVPSLDFLSITGDLNIVSGAILNASDLGSVEFEEGTQVPAFLTYSGAWNGGIFKIMEGATLRDLGDEGIFTMGLNEYQISYNGFDGVSNEVTLTVVPEPGTAAFLLGGLGLLLGARRRRVS